MQSFKQSTKPNVEILKDICRIAKLRDGHFIYFQRYLCSNPVLALAVFFGEISVKCNQLRQNINNKNIYQMICKSFSIKSSSVKYVQDTYIERTN